MLWEELCLSKAEAGQEFNERCRRTDGVTVLENLAAGMIILRDILYFRLHQDVERLVGEDSMYMPVSESRSQRRTKSDIELFQIAESTSAAKDPRSGVDVDWYLAWVTRYHRSPSPGQGNNAQLNSYLGQAPDARRLAFTDVLTKVLPESRRAPLVLFRLFPMAVQLATFLALGDRARGGAHPRGATLDAGGHRRLQTVPRQSARSFTPVRGVRQPLVEIRAVDGAGVARKGFVTAGRHPISVAQAF